MLTEAASVQPDVRKQVAEVGLNRVKLAMRGEGRMHITQLSHGAWLITHFKCNNGLYSSPPSWFKTVTSVLPGELSLTTSVFLFQYLPTSPSASCL